MARLTGESVAISIRSPWITILVFALLTLASAVYTARNFAINTDISNLIAPGIDWRQREIALEKAFPARAHTILAVVNAPTPELASLAADRLTEQLRGQPALFPEVRRPDGGEFFEKNALLFLPPDELGRTLGQLQQVAPFVSMLARNPNWRGLSQATQGAMIGVQGGRLPLDSLAPVFDRFSKTFEDTLAGRPATFSWQELLTNEKSKPGDLRKFVDILPKLDYSALEPGKQATDAVRQAAVDAKLGAGLPGARSPDRLGPDRRRRICHRQGGDGPPRHRYGFRRSVHPLACAQVRHESSWRSSSRWQAVWRSRRPSAS